MNLLNIKFKSSTTLVVAVAIFGLFGAFLLVPQAVDATPQEVSIPFYNTDTSCPEGFNQSYLNTYTIGSQDADGESFSVNSGTTYLFKASTTYRSSCDGCNWVSDAGFSTQNNWNVSNPYVLDFGIYGSVPNYGAHALLADLGMGVGIFDWGTYNSNHEYSATYTPTSDTAQFLIGDRYSNWFGTPWDNQDGMSDNSGSLTLDVYECVPNTATIHAEKIICNDEQYLPNMNGGSDITISTATNWLAQDNNSDNCWLADDWGFEWRYGGNDYNANDWNLFSMINPATVRTDLGRIETREVWNDNYIPFTGTGGSDITAEFFCANDVANYDNWEWINGVRADEDYYCIAFNVEKKICGDGDIDKPNNEGIIEQCDDGNLVNNDGCSATCQNEIFEFGINKFNDADNDGADDPAEQIISWQFYFDVNKNGQFDGGETSYFSWDDSTRYYGVGVGEYTLCEVPRAGWSQTYPSANECQTITMPDDVNKTFNFRNYYAECGNNIIDDGEECDGDIGCSNECTWMTYNLHGYKWHDVDGDQQRGEEELLGGWTINLYKDRSLEPYVTTTTATDGDDFGWYIFEDLPIGLYRICEVQKDGWEQTTPEDCYMITLPNDDPKTKNGVLAPEYNFGNRLTTNLTITKDVNKDVANIGDTLTYTITVENKGDADDYNFSLKDTLPTNTTLVADSWGGDLGDPVVISDEFTWGSFDLMGHTSYTATFQVTVNGELPVGETVITNEASLWQMAHTDLIDVVEAPVGILSFINKIFSINTAVAQEAPEMKMNLIATSNLVTTTVNIEEPFNGPKLTIFKDVDATEAKAGDTLNYTIVVKNVGDQPATDVVVDDVLPAGMIYQDGTTTKQWIYDVIASGATETINYVAIIEDDATAGSYTNTATVSASGLTAIQDDATTTIAEEVKTPIVLGEEALPFLTVDKTVNVKVANPGQTITYSVVVTNTGDALAEDVVLIDHIAPGLQFTDTAAPTHTWLLDDIMAGDSVTTTYDVIVLNDNEPGMYSNTAEVWAVGVDNVYDTAEVEVQTVKVLGAETLPTTGGSVMTFVYLIGAGLVVVFAGFVLKLTVAKK